jgi:hypothetical protein
MQATTVASWAAVIWRALEARGIAPRPVFERAGVDTEQLHDAGARIPLQAMRSLDLAVEAPDPFRGSAGQHIHPTTFHAWLRLAPAAHPREALDSCVSRDWCRPR